jgi:hypothetical protein
LEVGVNLLERKARGIALTARVGMVARPLQGDPPTIDLMMGYNKSNTSPLLMRFLSRSEELVSRVSQKHGLEAGVVAARSKP